MLNNPHRVDEFDSPVEFIRSFHLLLDKDHLSLMPYKIHPLSTTTDILLQIASLSNSFTPHAILSLNYRNSRNSSPAESVKNEHKQRTTPSPSDKNQRYKNGERPNTTSPQQSLGEPYIVLYIRLVKYHEIVYEMLCL